VYSLLASGKQRPSQAAQCPSANQLELATAIGSSRNLLSAYQNGIHDAWHTLCFSFACPISGGVYGASQEVDHASEQATIRTW
jgi:hypothetical protein